MTDVNLFDEESQTSAAISINRELVVGPVAYSKAYYVSITAAATPFEIVPAMSGKIFVITAMLLATSKTFGTATTAETLIIYESSPADISTSLGTLTQIDFLKNDRLVATSLTLATSTAVSLVATATDTDVGVTIAGYYVQSR